MAGLKEMFEIDPDILRAPRRDNSAYLEAIARMRKAALDAEIALASPVYLASSNVEVWDGNYVLKTVFRRVGE